MTDLIPLDAAIDAVYLAVWKSPIKAKISTIDASLDTIEALRAIPAIDPAAIREAALREAAEVATARWAARREHADRLAELDYPEAMIDAKTVSAKADEAQAIADQILAMIQKGADHE